MAFGPEYKIRDTQVEFGEVDPDVLAGHRPANERETRFLSATFRGALSDPKILHEYLLGEDTVSWALFVQKQLAGLAIIHSKDGIAFNRTLVFEEHQGNGLAKFAHIARMHHWFEELNATALVSYIDFPNAPSFAAAERRGYYHVEDREIDKVYRAVNPEHWTQFHELHPAQNATDESLARVKASLVLAREVLIKPPHFKKRVII
jgi:RimJ/RimL family protein N-acetyltransferase